MKKFFITVLLAVIIGGLFGKLVFNQYDRELQMVFKDEEVIYVLQQGVYSNYENIEKNMVSINYYIVHKDEDYYRVYVGITKDMDNVDKMRELFINNGNDIYVRELKNDNSSFLEVLGQYDMLLAHSNEEDQILQIQKQVLSKYEELVIGNE